MDKPASQPPVTMDGLVERLNQQHAAVLATLLATIERQREALRRARKIVASDAAAWAAFAAPGEISEPQLVLAVIDTALESQP